MLHSRNVQGSSQAASASSCFLFGKRETPTRCFGCVESLPCQAIPKLPPVEWVRALKFLLLTSSLACTA